MRHDRVLRKASAVAAAPADFAGRWRNELGSTVDLVVTGTDLTGSYESAVSGGAGPIAGTLVGYVSGDLIAFTVKWPTAAMTAWVGQLASVDGFVAIETLWQMTSNVEEADEPTGLWASINAGADVFVR